MGSSQRRAIQNYRTRLTEKGLVRFEVICREPDRELMRSLAKRLSEDTPDAERLRSAVSKSMAGDGSKTGGILAALRRSPLVGAGLDLSRAHEAGWDTDI